MKSLRALIGKNNIKNAKIRGNLFLVDTFNMFFDYCVNRYKDKLVTKRRDGLYLFTKQEIDSILENVEVPLSYFRTDDDFQIYDLTYFSEDEKEKLIHDINYSGEPFIAIVRKYKLKSTPYSKL